MNRKERQPTIGKTLSNPELLPEMEHQIKPGDVIVVLDLENKPTRCRVISYTKARSLSRVIIEAEVLS